MELNASHTWSDVILGWYVIWRINKLELILFRNILWHVEFYINWYILFERELKLDFKIEFTISFVSKIKERQKWRVKVGDGFGNWCIITLTFLYFVWFISGFMMLFIKEAHHRELCLSNSSCQLNSSHDPLSDIESVAISSRKRYLESSSV